MADRTLEVRKAIIAAVKADSALAGLGITQVHDWRPDIMASSEQEIAPYAAWGNSSSVDWNTHGSLGAELSVAIKVFARARGQVGVLRVMAALRAALDRAALTLDAGNALLLHYETQTVFTGSDGLTTEGTVVFRIYTHD